ncbi:hypothetical protein [Pseudobutyrivibrio sp.]|uniref:hypothetical protein n=1 Tax=Pseudobutyrivibrio sp. TaxID=2014367 RepID=UPI0038681AF9
MTWYKTSSTTKPKIIDDTLSKKYVYVRRNIVESEQIDDLNPDIKIKFYSFEEIKIPKDVYSIFEFEKTNSNRLDELEDTIVELLYGGE